MYAWQTPAASQEFNLFAKSTSTPRQCTCVYLCSSSAAHILPQRLTAWTRSKLHKLELSALWMAVTVCASTASNSGGINSWPIWANVWDKTEMKHGKKQARWVERKLHYNAPHRLACSDLTQLLSRTLLHKLHARRCINCICYLGLHLDRRFTLAKRKQLGITLKNKQTPWSESASELYRPSDRRLSAKWLPTFADKGCHVVGVTDPYSRILGFLDRSRYFSIK
jgi:hypothetical protein